MLDGEQVYLEGHKVIKPFKGQMVMINPCTPEVILLPGKLFSGYVKLPGCNSLLSPARIVVNL